MGLDTMANLARAERTRRFTLQSKRAGLSWLTNPSERSHLRAPLGGFDLDRVAAYDRRERHRRVSDAGIA